VHWGRFRNPVFFEVQDDATYMYWLKWVEVSMILSPSKYRCSNFKHKSGQLMITSMTEHEFFVGLNGSLDNLRGGILIGLKIC